MMGTWWLVAALLAAPSDYMGGTFCSTNGNIADAGTVRLTNNDNMCWRNAANDGNRCVYVNGDDRFMIPSYTKNQHIPIGAAVLGPTAPTATTLGNARCYLFNQAQTAETIYVTWIVGGEWDAASDMELHFRVMPEAGDVIADGEVIEFDVTYNVLSPGDAYDKASTTVSPSYTQSGAGTDKALLCLDGIIDYDDASNPLVANYEVFAQIDLDETATTYSGNPSICQIHTKFTAVTVEMKDD